jgi:hypothetical protein
MRKIAANFIYLTPNQLLYNGYLVIDQQGIIISIVDTGGKIPEIENLEYYSGILIPAIVDGHTTNTESPNILYTNQWPAIANAPLKTFARKAWRIGFQALPQPYEIYDIGILTQQLNGLKKQFMANASQANAREGIYGQTLLAAQKINAQHQCGSFEPGKNPGGLIIEGYSHTQNLFLPKVTLERLF